MTYNAANQILSGIDNRSHNANGQLTEIWAGSYHYKHNYSATQNNGRITSMQDVASGETITYAYDSLNRLISASDTGDSQGNWSQAFSYDGFGNLTSKIGNNAPNVTSYSVNPATNRITSNGAVYDANGNMTANGSPGQVTGFGYDEANRLSGVQLPGSPGNGSMAEYSYDAANQRIYASITTTVNSVQTTNNYIYFYGADGKKLGVWQLTTPSNIDVLTLVSMNLWFGGRLLKGEDRLQSVGKYFPYGEDRYNPTPANPSNDQEKFATYTRDSISGLDYAVNRYYAAGMGRFMSPDPYRGSASPRSPQTWNRYPFTPGDPVNYNDAKGLTPTCASTGADCCDPDIDPWCDPCDPGDPGGEHTFGLRFVSSFGGNDEPCEPDPGPQLPDCTIGLFQRGVPFPGSPAVHTYLVLTETEPDGEIDIDDVLEGGPQNPHSPIFNPRMLWGNLIGYIEAVPQNPIGIVKGKFGKKGTFLGSTNPYTNERIGFEVGPDTCSELSSLLDVVNNYDATAGVLYAPIPNGGTTYNSNSFTYSLLYDIGLAGILSPTAWAPSWGQLVPGLNW